MPYTAGNAAQAMTVGPQIAAQGISSAAQSLQEMMAKIGIMHLQDRQAAAQIDAFKAAGYFADQPGKPGSAMMPSALLQAANKGPLGTKTALASTMQNYLEMNYRMRQAYQQHAMEQGGFVNPQGQGGSPQSQAPVQRQAPAQNSLYDRQNAPPTASGLNIEPTTQSNPYAAPGGPTGSPVEED
jgi:hypothetical protein